MKRYPITVALVLMALVAVTLTCFYRSNTANFTPPALAQEPKRDRWEYGELAMVLLNSATWEGPDGARYDADSYKGLAEKMRIKVEKDDSTAILNALGADGWELVTHTSRTHETLVTSVQIWTLKRRK